MTLSDWVSRAAESHRAGRPLALFFDFDGTLSPLVPHPSLASLPAAAREALGALSRHPGVTIGILSGRPLGQLKQLVGLDDIWYAGSGGMHLELNGREAIDEALSGFEAVTDALTIALGELMRWFPQVWVEWKPGCLTVHYRALPPEQSEHFVAAAIEALAELEPDCPVLRVVDADQALEVSLAGSWTKGEAVGRMLDACGVEAFAVYVGNSANDEPAVHRVNEWGGFTIRVGDKPAAAQAVLATPRDLSDALVRMAFELRGSRRQPA